MWATLSHQLSMASLTSRFHTTPQCHLPHSSPALGPQAWTHCISLLTGIPAAVLPLSLLLSPNRPNRSTHGAGLHLSALSAPRSLLWAAHGFPGPSQVQLHPHKPSFLNMACLFMLPSIFMRLFPCPGMLITLFTFSHQLRFLFLLRTHA